MKTRLAQALETLPQAKYHRCIFVLGHMRAGSTALTNVLAAHPQISGCGEAHVAYGAGYGPGRLLLRLMHQRALSPTARFLCDKILHSPLHHGVPEGFYDAHAVFILRSPGPAIASIQRLSQKVPQTGLADLERAGAYYLDRLAAMDATWVRFAPSRRVGISADALWEDPEGTLARVSERLPLETPLRNHFAPQAKAQRAGGGDPLADPQAARIIARRHAAPQALHCADALQERCARAYAKLLGAFRAEDA
ncbi:MAG: sulfotransferase [Pseudomonadota bacterium]